MTVAFRRPHLNASARHSLPGAQADMCLLRALRLVWVVLGYESAQRTFQATVRLHRWQSYGRAPLGFSHRSEIIF